MVTSMPLMSKSVQIMHRHPIIQRDMANIEFSHVSISHFHENSRAIEKRFSEENEVRDMPLNMVSGCACVCVCVHPYAST